MADPLSELAGLGAALDGRSVILDGELVAFSVGSDSRPRAREAARRAISILIPLT